ncbi:MAG: CoA transferase [Actinomyces sp.]|nr:MAG: CoA transferase [Actinomyces sp.]
MTLEDGSVMKLASGFIEYDGERVGPVGRPPHPGEHTDEVFADLGTPRPAPSGPRPEPAPPLADLSVLDFGHGGVGVETGRLFAEYGADVVKIESRSYPDFIRVVLGGEMSPSFASSSRSKRSFGVDMKSEQGRELLLRLAESAHVVIENNSTGTMDRLGLGFADFRRRNPGIVMMSSQLMGSRGRWADWRGYGPNTQVTGGMTHLWNYEDLDEPAGSQSIFPDHFAGRVGAVAALAALVGRERLGLDATHAEVCQVEQVVGVMADLLALESLAPGTVRPRGNHSDRGVPWGLYPCAGDDRWVAVCVRDDAEWAALVEVLGSPPWAADPALAGVEGRRAAEALIDEHLAAWTAGLDRYEVTDRLLAAGVPAGPMLTAVDQLHDPHFAAKGFAVWLDQPPIGRLAMEGAGFDATGMVGPRIAPAPLLGEHTRDIARHTLGLDDDEIDTLIAEGILEITDTGGDTP